jgi:uncharacterized protein YjiS (DUF1127 family)
MTRLPSAYPHQVVSDWIAANDVHVLADSVEKKLMDVTWGDYSSLPDYDVSTRRARKMQAEAIAAISRTIGKAIGRVVSNSISSLGSHWCTRRQIERLSRLSPRLLDDAGIPREIQVRIRVRQTHSQTHRIFLYL